MAVKNGMSRFARYFNASLLLGFAAAIIIAISPWSAFSNTDPNYHGWNLFSYFTVQSNLIAATVFTIGAIALIKNKQLGTWFGMLRGAAVLYMLVTALVYALLLQDANNAHSALAFNWKNFILHQLTPLFIVAEWLLWPSRQPISARRSLIWLIFPVAWLTYTLIRAHIIHWYPYPFLDPALSGGAVGVTAYIIGITVGFALLCQGVAWVSRERRREPISATSPRRTTIRKAH